MIDEPVKREVFSASSRDRIVHHLLINIVGECLEKRFIYDSYACRGGKGTHLGINRFKRATAVIPDGWVLKMDIRSFFININRICFGIDFLLILGIISLMYDWISSFI